MSNALNDKQKDALYQWLRSGKAGDLSRKEAAHQVTLELGFVVTYTNMRSAEEVTGISLVKVPEVKRDEDKEYMASLLINVMHKVGIAIPMRLHQISLAMQIKPSAPKPTICHKHG